MASDQELQEEQRFLDLAYDGLEAMRSEANRMLGSVLDLGRGGTFQSRTERDIVVRTSMARLAQLDIGDQALCFGRIDRAIGAIGADGTGGADRADGASALHRAAGTTVHRAAGADRVAGAGPADGHDQGPGSPRIIGSTPSRVPDRAATDGAGASRTAEHREGAPVTESFHIGRLAVSGPDHEPLIVDWRAPVAEPFYRATGVEPLGLVRRRHLAIRGRRVEGIEDEYFGRRTDGSGRPGADGSETDEAGADGSGLVLGGPGALLAALGRARTGHMGDIVATIQREQDEIIRSPLPGVQMVQGGPGTGKTAVALHRAAYLLYTHRFPLERQGVLVVGPNPLFLRYIERVLPSLGETGVTLSTISGLVPEVRAEQSEPTEVARLKGDPRMSEVLARAVRTRQRRLPHLVEIPLGASVLRMTPADSARLVALARRRRGPHNARRRFVEGLVVRHLADQYQRARSEHNGPGPAEPVFDPDETGATDGMDRTDPSHPTGGGQLVLFGGGTPRPSDPGSPEAPPPGPSGAPGGAELDLDDFRSRLRKIPAYGEALDRMWPRLGPHELLRDLFGARPLLAAAGEGVLSVEEQGRLYRPRQPLEEVPWTAADVALIDEARVLLGPRTTRPARGGPDGRAAGRGGQGDLFEEPPPPVSTVIRRSGEDQAGAGLDEPIRAFGHIVVDEVQDLSPMQLRMLARRSISGSMTVVGDLAQATGPFSASSWTEIARHLAARADQRLVELTVSYRTPTEVMEVAAGVLARAVPDLVPPRTVRSSGHRPSVFRAEAGRLGAKVVEAVVAARAAAPSGKVAVLVPGSLLAATRGALAEAGLDPVDPRSDRVRGLSADLVVLPASAANGLEFDAVVVVEPALVAAGDPDAGPDGPPTDPVAGPQGLRMLYVALTRPTQMLALVHSLELPVPLPTDHPARDTEPSRP